MSDTPRTDHIYGDQAHKEWRVGHGAETLCRELERENANHEAVRKECCTLLGQIRDEVMKHEDEPAPKGFSWVRFCELGDRMSCLLRGIKIE